MKTDENGEVNGNGELAVEKHDGGEEEEQQKMEDVLKKRELEQELENERPCVFKSTSPVSLFFVTDQ